MASLLKRLRDSLAPRPVEGVIPGPFEVKILGDTGFVDLVRSALDLLESRCPELYQEAISHVAVIEGSDGETGEYHREPPLIVLPNSIGFGRDLSPRSKTVWYAGVVVHQACHSRLRREHCLEHPAVPWPTDERSMLLREDACLQIQYEALQRIGASLWMLDYVKSRINQDPRSIANRTC